MGNMQRVMTGKKVLISKEVVVIFNGKGLTFLVKVMNRGDAVAASNGSKGRVLSNLQAIEVGGFKVRSPHWGSISGE